MTNPFDVCIQQSGNTESKCVKKTHEYFFAYEKICSLYVCLHDVLLNKRNHCIPHPVIKINSHGCGAIWLALFWGGQLVLFLKHSWTKAIVTAASSSSLLVGGDGCRSVFNTRALVRSGFGSRTAAVIYNFTYRFPFAAASVLRGSR